MSRYTIFAVIAALCLTTASADLTSATFTGAPPGKVFDGTTGAADVLTWGADYESAKFGPGTDNTTVYAYGFDVATAAITKIITRKLNATLLSNGTAATAVTDAKIGDDVVYSTAIAITSGSTPIFEVGLGVLAAAFTAADSNSCNQVYISVFTAGSFTKTTAITSNTCVTTAASAAVTCATFANVVTSLFYENSTFYASYTTVKTTAAYDATVTTGNVGCSATTAQLVTSGIQGVAATSAGTLKWTTAVTIYTGTSAATASPTAATVAPTCGPQNYTNSTNFYCVYQDAASAWNLKAVKITVESGTADSGTTIATSTAYSTAPAAATTYNAYTIAGFVYGLYQQGILINNQGSVYAASGTSPTGYTNALHLYNLTSGATTTTGATLGGIALTGYTNAPTTASQAFAGAGITYGTGYAILDYYTASAITTYEYQAFLANSTVNVTKATVAAQSPGKGNWFADANGALWFGGYTLTATPTITTGYVGRLVAQLYSAGNVLASFFALISLMIAALFAF